MAYFVSGPAVGKPGDIDDTARNPLGMERTADNGYTYKYLKGVASTITGSWVSFEIEGFTTVGLDTDVATSIVSCVAVATAAVVANKFGWYGIDGIFAAGAVTSTADNAKVFPTTTVFICDDASVAGSQVWPAVWRSAEAAGLANVEIHRPMCGVNVA